MEHHRAGDSTMAMGKPRFSTKMSTRLTEISCHAFKWVNKDGKFVYIKYHFIAEHGQKQFTAAQAIQLSGEDPDYSKRDL